MPSATITGTETTRQGQRVAAVFAALIALGLTGAVTVDVEQNGGERPEAGREDEPSGESPAAASEAEIRALIARLDAGRFAWREQATRELLTCGKQAVPYLVEALGDDSSEVCFRARALLSDHQAFEDVALPLAGAVESPRGFRARAILRQRAAEYLESALQRPHTEQLLLFWGTTGEAYRLQTRTVLADADSCAEMTRAIRPLIGLNEKVVQFNDLLQRLDAISLAHDHRQSPGFAIAETLAGSLRDEHPTVAGRFTERYLESLETLVAAQRPPTGPSYAAKKEAADRATMSRSAAEFLLEILDEASPSRAILCERIGVRPEWLQDEFFCGLSLADPVACNVRVGKVHIADMLTRVFRQWPDAPQEGAVEQLLAGTRQTIVTGDKPKALALLDALNACRELPQHGLDVRTGLGKQLGERLTATAVAAANIRLYHPARSTHDKFLHLIELGISPEHEAFPDRLLADYLQGIERATSDEQRLALDRYLNALERLGKAGLTCEQPGTRRFALALRDSLTERHELLAAGAARLAVLTAAPQSGEPLALDAVDRELAEWVANALPD